MKSEKPIDPIWASKKSLMHRDNENFVHLLCCCSFPCRINKGLLLPLLLLSPCEDVGIRMGLECTWFLLRTSFFEFIDPTIEWSRFSRFEFICCQLFFFFCALFVLLLFALSFTTMLRCDSCIIIVSKLGDFGPFSFDSGLLQDGLRCLSCDGVSKFFDSTGVAASTTSIFKDLMRRLLVLNFSTQTFFRFFLHLFLMTFTIQMRLVCVLVHKFH